MKSLPSADYYASIIELLGAVAAITALEIILKRLNVNKKPASKEEFHRLVESIKT